MNYIYCTSPDEWESHLQNFPEANFLQSWQWGEFQESLGKQVSRLVLTDISKIIGVAQIIREPAKRGAYLAIPGGPLIDWTHQPAVQKLFQELVKLSKVQRCLFIRFRPQIEQDLALSQIFEKIGARVAPMHLTAELTIEIDLTKSNEVLKAEMRKQHRQALKKAQELGIIVKQSQNKNELALFYREQLAVAKRQGFVPFTEQFLLKQFDAFVVHDQVVLFHAYYQDILLASAFVIFCNGEAVYHYGISTSENKNYPGSYACQWEIIQEAKRRGCSRYNLWGVSPKDAVKHRFYGVGLFKRGFGGSEKQYVFAHDLPVSWKYWFTWIFEIARKKLRRL